MWINRIKNNANKSKYRILSIDGGGMKGVFTAYALMKLKQEFDINVLDYFDMITGTSTGALIATSILNGKDPKEIYEYYIDPNNEIFSEKIPVTSRLSTKFMAQFKSKGLENYLERDYSNLTLDELFANSKKKDFAFFATNFNKAQPVIFASPKLRGTKIARGNTLIKEVLRATTAAPFYFEPFKDSDDNYLVDGGLWANNPSLASVNLAMSELGIKEDQIEVLSFGQSYTSEYSYDFHSAKEVITSPTKQQFVQLLKSTLALNQNSQSILIENLLGNSLYRYEPIIMQENVSISKVDTKFLNYTKVHWIKNKDDLVKFIKYGENDDKIN